MCQSFQVLPYRFNFRSQGTVLFPARRPGNIVRGGFGAALRKIVCVPTCAQPKTCDRRAICPYALIFEPRSSGVGPSGLADKPRPFVFRTHHLDGCTVEPGMPFYIDLHLFEVRAPMLRHFVDSLRLLASEGLGPGRGRATLESVDLLDQQSRPRWSLGAGTGDWAADLGDPLDLSLTPDLSATTRILVRFATPTDLKGGRGTMERPEFALLMARIRDRLSALRALYGQGRLQIDFKAFGERAGRVSLVRADMRRVDVSRRSSRSGDVHPIGGFEGVAEYEGDLAEFVPYLRAAYWTGVGRQTVWGNGVIQPRILTPGVSADSSVG